MTIARALLVDETANPTLSSVATRLEAALDRAEYEHSYYVVPGGFVIVARLERVDESGKPLPEDFRFLPPDEDPYVSFADFIRALFFAPAGHYRMIAFMTTDQTFQATAPMLTGARALELLEGGAPHLAARYAEVPFTANHKVDALIYEFRKGEGDRNVSQLTPGQFAAKTNLVRAGLYAALIDVAAGR